MGQKKAIIKIVFCYMLKWPKHSFHYVPLINYALTNMFAKKSQTSNVE